MCRLGTCLFWPYLAQKKRPFFWTITAAPTKQTTGNLALAIIVLSVSHCTCGNIMMCSSPSLLKFIRNVIKHARYLI